MTKILPPLAAALLTALSAAAAPIAADSHITAVTVYADRAVVTRDATLDVAAGPVEVTFAQLPAALLDPSLQVSGQGTAQTTLLDVTARSAYVDFTPNERVKALEDQLRELARKDRALADRSTVLDQQRNYVLKIQNASTTPTPDAAGSGAMSSPEIWTKMLAFSADQLGKIAAELQSADAGRADLKSQREALEKQLAELRGAGGRSYKTVTVRLDAATAGKLDLTLRYAVSGARWSPAYDARVSGDEQTAQLGYFGVVRQNTGEDWSQVDLTLSTARPALGGSPPPLDPWTVDVRVPRPMARDVSRNETITLSPFSVEAAKGKGYVADSSLAGTRLHQTETAQASVAASATSASFHIPAAATIPSDNAPQKVSIAHISLTAATEYQAIPKQLAAAFLTAKVTNTSAFPLLAGPMNVFLDDTFVAAATLRTVMPGEKFDLALGADEGIAVKRTLNRRFTESTGLMTKSQRITYDFTLTVQNNKKAAAKVVVLDQVPVSRNEKIVVKLVAPDERVAKPEADGTLKWTLELKPGEKRELPLTFTVEYPADLAVTGLE
jgi:uncharacterized protein (TIGR02231 family)